jgi:sigma-B regulation protein RsbU (phosphoserine phosphatase)
MMNPMPSQSSLLVRSIEGESRNRIAPAGQVLRELNRRFPMEESGGRFFSIFYGILHVPTLVLQAASAGHPPVMRVASDQSVTPLEPGGMLIGIVDDYEYEQCELQLNAGDRLVAYSDGVVEQQNAEDEEFGEQRLIRRLAESRPRPLAEAVRSLEADVVAWSEEGRLTDDLSILAVEID